MWRAVELAGPAARKIRKDTDKGGAKKIKKIVIRKKRVVAKKHAKA
jgi:hypothetical protein